MSKKTCLARYQNKRVKLKGKGIRACFAKHTLSPKKIRPDEIVGYEFP